MRRRLPFLALLPLLLLPASADTPIATTLYREGDGKIEGDLLADTVRSVAVSGDTVTVVQRDADAAESSLRFDVGGTPDDGSITKAKLDSDVVAVLDNAVQVDGIDLNGGELEFAAENGVITRIQLPAATGGLDQAAVDARVAAGTKPAARAGGTARWTAAEIPTLASQGLAETDGDWLAGSRLLGDFAAASNNGIPWHDSGHDIPGSAVALRFDGGAATVDVAALLALPDGAAGSVAAPAQRLSVDDAAGDAVYFGHAGRRLLLGYENVSGFAVDGLAASIRRLEPFADRDQPDAQIPASRLENAPQSGLDQDAVDARVDALVPPARRIPPYAQGDAGQVVRVNAGGTGLEIAPAGGSGEANPAAATQAEAEAGTETGLRSWSPQRVRQAVQALANRVLVALGALPAVDDHEAGDIVNRGGVLYELVAGTVDPHVYRGTLADRAGTYVGDDTFEWDEADHIRANLGKAVLGGSPPTQVYIEVHSGGYYAETSLTRAPSRDTAQTWGYDRTADDPALETDTITVGSPFDVSFYSDGALSTPFRIQSASANRWERDDRDASAVDPVALLGDTARWPKSKLPADALYRGDLPHDASETYDESFPGLTITRTDRNVRITQPIALTPALTLSGSNARGEFHASLHATLTPVSDVNMAFERNAVNADAEQRMVLLSNVAFASDLLEEAAFDNAAQSSYHGLVLFRLAVYSANTTVGHYNVLLVRSATNAISVFRHWEGAAGATGASISAEFRLTFTPSDAPAGGGFAVPAEYVVRFAPVSNAAPYVNRKNVAADAGKLVESPWEALSLASDATPASGVTVANDRIVFAEARTAIVSGAISTEVDGSGGAARSYVAVRVVRKGTPDTVLKSSLTQSYNKTTSHDATSSGSEDLTQGPRAQVVSVSHVLHAEAGGEYELQWRAFLQTSSFVRLVPADSEIALTFVR